MPIQKLMLLLLVMIFVTACVRLEQVTGGSNELSHQARESVVQQGKRLTIQTDKSQQTLVCDNQDIVIRGRDNMITLTGTCESLEVLGSDNMIRVEQVEAIAVDGDDNMVTWQQGVDADTPTITNTGTDNRIQQGREQEQSNTSEEVAEESSINDLLGGDIGSVSIDLGDLESLIGQVGNPEDIIAVAGTGDVSTYTCENNSVIVTGAENTVTLEGTCEAIIVAGANNDIFVEAVVSGTLTGAENTIIWQSPVDGQPPNVNDTGVNNRVEQQATP